MAETQDGAERQQGRFATLLVTQLGFIALIPFVTDRGFGAFLLHAGVWSIILLGVYIAKQRRGLFTIALFIMVSAIGAWLGPDVFDGEIDNVLRMATAAVSFVFTAYVVVTSLLEQDRVNLDTILGGINAYLLLAFAFMFLHASLLVVDPNGYTFAGEPLMAHLQGGSDSHGYATMLYFSFATLTTLGFGDIVPLASTPRLLTSAQAVLGQLYVAIFIGRLVALEVGRHISKS